ncbi:SWIM zinc finger family protein [Streptomyces sp. NPDC021100]|uniref:SWIM zinc finger family protein n=1 Tax=Streptomyces sp. NPDC021100 TaxID=3365114 RepID=UPI00379AA623
MSTATRRTAPAREKRNAREKPAAPGGTWWSRRWIRALESLGATYPNPRLPRGRTLARQGAVQGLTVRPGEVTARVELARTSCRVTLRLPVLDDAEWSAGVRVLAGQLRQAASLLEGRMPEDIDATFGKAGIALFPRRGELSCHCDCRDGGDPCSHGAAVHYAFADALQDNPFLLPALRGRSRERLLTALRATRSGGAADASAAPETVAVAELAATDAYFTGGDLTAVPLHPQPPADPARRLRRLGPPPGCSPADAELLAGAVERAAAHAWRMAGGSA